MADPRVGHSRFCPIPVGPSEPGGYCLLRCLAPSSSGLGHYPLTVAARVRIPLGLLVRCPFDNTYVPLGGALGCLGAADLLIPWFECLLLGF